MESKSYENLLSEGHLGNLTLRNKTIMSAMGMNQSENGFVNEAVINHYAERAKGGVGLIIVEVTCVDAPAGKNTANMLLIDDDKYIDGMSKLASSIHQYGSKCLLQISHTGRGARRKITGLQPVGPSAVPMPYSFMMGLSNETPRELTIPEIENIEDKYARAAYRAKKAGFDGVEIHSCGYYLGAQFLSSTANIRSDEYGGSPENRVRFHVNVINKIKELCGSDFTVVVKFSALEVGPHAGITIEEGMYYAYRFQEAGADGLEVLAGTWKEEADENDKPDTASGKGTALGLAMAIKMGIMKFTGKPVAVKIIGGGRSQDPQVAEDALVKGMCDFIFIGKGLLAQPNLINLIRDNKLDEIRPCIGCGACIDVQLQGGKRSRCSGNAVLGHEDNDYNLEKAKKSKKVIVVGGGVAGVEAARIAAIRGHDVTLYEKDSKLGGQLFYAIAPPYKNNITPLIGYLENQLNLNKVKVVLNKCVSSKEVIAENPDVVICATGVQPAKLPIKGFERAINAKEVLLGKETGEKVVIIGGGVVGCETAELLLEAGKKVTIVEMVDDVAMKMVNTARSILLGHLKAFNADIRCGVRCKEIGDSYVVVENKDGHEIKIPADTVLISIGDRPDNILYEELKGKLEKVYNVGDSNTPDCIATAVSQGYYAALDI